MTTSTSGVPAGWYPDPNGTRGRRYFDGAGWTDFTEPDPPPVRTLTDDERATILNRTAAAAVAQGARIESHAQFQVVIVHGRPVNHTLHALLTIFTCACWGIVWLIMATTQGERRDVIEVDDYGNVMRSGLTRTR